MTEAQVWALGWLRAEHEIALVLGGPRTKKDFFHPATVRSLGAKKLIKVSASGSVRITRKGLDLCKKKGIT